ncbi:MAG: hypothetical protein AB7E32_14010 [Desulfovibrio sp.]
MISGESFRGLFTALIVVVVIIAIGAWELLGWLFSHISIGWM